MTVIKQKIETDYGPTKIEVTFCDVCSRPTTGYETANWLYLATIFGGSLDVGGNFCSAACLRAYVNILPDEFDFRSIGEFLKRLDTLRAKKQSGRFGLHRISGEVRVDD